MTLASPFRTQPHLFAAFLMASTARCADLEEYVKECGKEKQTMLLINKADFLTDEYR